MISGTIALLVGILLFQHSPELPPAPFAAALTALLFLLPALGVLRPERRPLVLTASALLAGFLWAWWHAAGALAERLPPSLDGVDLRVTGVVASIPEPRERRVVFEFVPETALRDGELVPLNGRLRLSWYAEGAEQVSGGERWRLTMRLKRPRGMYNPGGFDYEGWLFRNGISASGYVREPWRAERVGEASGYALLRLREGLSRRIDALLSGSPTAGLVRALVVGDRQGLDGGQWDVLTATGTGHLMAISGLHVGMVAALAFFLARWGWARCPVCCMRLAAPRAAALIALLFAAGYAALAGFALPTQRALVMLAAGLGALWWLRVGDPARALSGALLAVLLLDPASVLAPGMWLSFGAVAALLYAMAGRLGPRGRWWAWGRSQWVVAVGLLPVLALWFQEASPLAPVVNLLAIPWVTFLVVPQALAGAVLLGPLPWLGEGLLLWAALALQPLWAALESAAGWLGGVALSAPSATVLALALVGAFWLLAPRGVPGRPVGALCLLPLLWPPPDGPAPGAIRLVLLDVGQALAVVVRTAGHTLVYDTGARYSERFDAGSGVVLPYLRQAGVGSVDRLLVSHGDGDHSGGLPAVRAAFAAAPLLAGGEAAGELGGVACRRGDHWRWDGVDFRILYPDVPVAGNDGSCVVKVEGAFGSVLLPGDVEAAGEAALLKRPDELKADVLVAPHHGSTTSSTPGFVRAVAAAHVLYSVGYANRYGFPDPQVTGRYAALGAVQSTTAEGGTLTLDIGPNGISERHYRQTHRRYWHLGAQ